MIYRIDFQTFLLHGIDYFTREELMDMKYMLVTLKLMNGGAVRDKVTKYIDVVPNNIVGEFDPNTEKEKFRRAYLSMLKERNYIDETLSITASIYKNILHPLVNHEDRMLMCDQTENYMLDIFCEFLKDKFNVDVINLNKLLLEGDHDTVKYKYQHYKNLCHKIHKEVADQYSRDQCSTSKGRKKILKKWSSDQKARQLKMLGVNAKKYNKKDYDKILTDLWVNQ